MRIPRTTKSLFLFVALIALVTAVGIGQTRKPQKSQVQSARVNITRMGYEPATLKLKQGIAARITFVRMTDDTCAMEVVFPSHGIRRDLPLNQAVTISLTRVRIGEFSFTCGMGMHRGRLIVQ